MRVFWNHIADWFAAHIGPYWSPVGLVNMVPPEKWVFQGVYVALIIACGLVGAAMLFAKKLDPGLRDRISSFGWNNLVIGLILYFFRIQRIPLLGMDGWRFIQEVGMIVWIVLIVRYWRHHLPLKQFAEQVAAHKAKYLPKPKKA